MSQDEDAPTGAVALAEARKARRRTQQRIRRTDALIVQAQEAGKLKPGERKCNGKVRLKDPVTKEPLKDETGKPLYRPCTLAPILGGTVCHKHGGNRKLVQKNAQKRLLALVEPSLVALNELVVQKEHLPSRLGAIRTVLERVEKPFGVLKESASDTDSRPVVNIGIAVGGIPLKPAEVKIGLIPSREVSELPVSSEEIVEADVAEEEPSKK